MNLVLELLLNQLLSWLYLLTTIQFYISHSHLTLGMGCFVSLVVLPLFECCIKSEVFDSS